MRHHSMLLRPAQIVCVFSACAFATVLLTAAEPTAVPANSPNTETIARWIQELDAESYRTRETASTSLLQAGPAAVDLLAQAVGGPSAEVSTRASSLLLRIAEGADEATLNQVATALQKLGSKRAAVAAITAEINSRQQKFKHTRAIAHVRSLGGGLTGSFGDHLSTPEAVLLPGPLLVEDVAVAPAFAIEEAVPLEAPAIEAPAPPKRGLAGLLARLILPAADPAPAEFAPAPLDLVPDAIPVPIAPDAVPLVPAREVAPPIEAVEPPAAEAIPRFDERPALPEVPVAPPPAELFPADAIEVLEVPAIRGGVEEVPAGDVEIVEVADFAFAPAPIMIGPAVEIGEGETEAYAELVLDKSFRGTDKDLAVLKDIPEIYSLSLHGAKLTDEALSHIAALPRLTTLNVRDTLISSAALRKLRQQRPELSIICRSPAMLGINAGLEGPCILTSVFFKSGAQEAGLRDGDEIIEVDGHKVRDFSDLTIAVYPHIPGEKLNVKFRRGEAVESVDVLLKSRDAVEQ